MVVVLCPGDKSEATAADMLKLNRYRIAAYFYWVDLLQSEKGY